ncbi:MerC domain-containing protein, partial [Rhodanobacter denitrificans]|nr:MerC domain-containing protein [Rhodanobacter denitrificans]
LRLAAPGLALLLLGVIYIDGSSPILHSVLVTCGGLLLASAHFVNLRLDSPGDGDHVHGPQCAH